MNHSYFSFYLVSCFEAAIQFGSNVPHANTWFMWIVWGIWAIFFVQVTKLVKCKNSLLETLFGCLAPKSIEEYSQTMSGQGRHYWTHPYLWVIISGNVNFLGFFESLSWSIFAFWAPTLGSSSSKTKHGMQKVNTDPETWSNGEQKSPKAWICRRSSSSF